MKNIPNKITIELTFQIELTIENVQHSNGAPGKPIERDLCRVK